MAGQRLDFGRGCGESAECPVRSHLEWQSSMALWLWFALSYRVVLAIKAMGLRGLDGSYVSVVNMESTC